MPLRLLGQGKCDYVIWLWKKIMGRKNIFLQQTLKPYKKDIGQDLVFYHSPETIDMIEDLHQQTGYADANKPGRTNPIWFQENVQLLVTWKTSLAICQMTLIWCNSLKRCWKGSISWTRKTTCDGEDNTIVGANLFPWRNQISQSRDNLIWTDPTLKYIYTVQIRH